MSGRRLLIFLPGLLLAACATTTPGKPARSLSADDGLRVTAKQSSSFSDLHDTYYDVTFANHSSRWIRIHNISVLLHSMDQNSTYPLTGQDLWAWIDSNEIKMKTRRQREDTRMEFASLGGLVATVAGVASDDSGLTDVGLGVTGGAALQSSVDKLRRSKADTERARQNPDSYLLTSFSIPPDGYARKWLVLYHANIVPADQFLMKLRTVDGRTMKYEVASH